jgi:hypothetical protein
MRQLVVSCRRHLRDRQVQALGGMLIVAAAAIPLCLQCVEQFH